MFCPRCGTWAADEAAQCQLCGAGLRGDHVSSVEYAQVAAPPAPPATFPAPYGGFWRRFAAVVLDTAVLWFPKATVNVWLGLDPFGKFDAFSTLAWTGAGFEFGIGWLYAALLIRSSSRATLGLQAMGLEVTDLHGGRVSFARATWRYWAQLLSLFTLGIGYLMQVATPRRQTLHDLVSGTVVVRARHQPARAETPVLRTSP